MGIGPYGETGRRGRRPLRGSGPSRTQAPTGKRAVEDAGPYGRREGGDAVGEVNTADVRESLALKRRANALRKSMEASLQARGLTEQIYGDMVGDYLELWWTRAELEADIRERGVTVMDEKRGLPVENCSVSARVRVSAQMAKLYKALGCQELAVKNQAPEEDDEL